MSRKMKKLKERMFRPRNRSKDQLPKQGFDGRAVVRAQNDVLLKSGEVALVKLKGNFADADQGMVLPIDEDFPPCRLLPRVKQSTLKLKSHVRGWVTSASRWPC